MRARERERRIVPSFDQPNGGKDPLVRAFTPLKKVTVDEATKLRRRK